MDKEKLQELFSSDGWEAYLDVLKEEMEIMFNALFILDPSKPDNFLQFVIYKTRIDTLRDITYFAEMEAFNSPDQKEAVNAKYKGYIQSLFDRLFRRS